MKPLHVIKPLKPHSHSGKQLKRLPQKHPAHCLRITNPNFKNVEINVGYFPPTRLTALVNNRGENEWCSSGVNSYTPVPTFVPATFIAMQGHNLVSYMYWQVGPYCGMKTEVITALAPHVWSSGSMCGDEAPSKALIKAQKSIDFTTPLGKYQSLCFVYNTYWGSALRYWDMNPDAALPISFVETVEDLGWEENAYDGIVAWFKWLPTHHHEVLDKQRFTDENICDENYIIENKMFGSLQDFLFAVWPILQLRDATVIEDFIQWETKNKKLEV